MSNGSGRINRDDRPTNIDRNNSDLDGGLTLKNLAGNLVENIVIKGNTEVTIPHRLKTIPKGRIVLRQIGNLILQDGDTPWTDKSISLKVVGSGTITVSIFILR